jgi:protein-L-isoaspartate(D-aspartate) O-methyltransferase
MTDAGVLDVPADTDRARFLMVEGQVRTNDVTDRALQAALRAIPREAFVAPARRAFAYAEAPVEGLGQRMLARPRDLAKLLQACDAGPGVRTCVIAGGSGYAAALLAHMGAVVTVLEDSAERADAARAACAALGLTVAAATGDLAAPPAGLDLIVVEGSVEEVSAGWTDALTEGGRLAVVVRDGPVGQARLYTKSGAACAFRRLFDAATPPLAGFERKAGFSF